MLNLRLDCPMGKVCEENTCQWGECSKQLPNQFNGVSKVNHIGVSPKGSKKFPFRPPPPSVLRPPTWKKLPLTLPLSDLRPQGPRPQTFQ